MEFPAHLKENVVLIPCKRCFAGREYDAEILKKSVYRHPVSYIYCFEGNVLKYRVVSGLYYDTSMNPINEVTTYRSISTKVDAKLFDLSNYSLMP